MDLKEQTYSVLVVSASEKFNQSLPEAFPCRIFTPVCCVPGISAAKRAFSERDFDIIVVNSPLPDDTGIHFSADSCESRNSVVLFLARDEQYETAHDTLSKCGVFLMRKPVSVASLRNASDWLVSARERIRKTEKKALSIEEKMNEIRLVNRAKWLLISELKMTEPDAHRYIEKQAMDRCETKSRVAEEIIRIYS